MQEIEKCSKELEREAEFLEQQTPLEILEQDHAFSAPSRHDNEIEKAVYRIQEEANKMVELLKARKSRGHGIDEADLTWLTHHSKIIEEEAKAKKIKEELLRDLKYSQDHNNKMIAAKREKASA